MVEAFFRDNLIQFYNKSCYPNMDELPDESVQCVVTSPPYWGLRKYAGNQDLIWDNHNGCEHDWQINNGDLSSSFCAKCGAWRGAFGLEPTPELYILHSVQILQVIRRALRKDGVVWWNIGDSYAGSGSPGGDYRDGRGGDEYLRPYNRKGGVLKPLDISLIPQRLSIALQEDGWYVRSLVIWNKKNPMPESVNGWRWERHMIRVKTGKAIKGETKADRPLESPNHSYRGDGWEVQSIEGRPDSEYVECPGCPKCSPNGGYVLRRGSWRPTEAHEYILMLAKSGDYYGDAEAVREAYTAPMNRWGGDTLKRDTSKTAEYKEIQQIGYSSAFRVGRPMRPNENGRNLRSVWTFPTRPCPDAHFAVFPERLPELCIKASTPEVGCCANCGAPWARVLERHGSGPVRNERKNTDGWRPTCKCGTEKRVPSLVLDPFMGRGTTLWVAKKLGRRAAGYDIAEDYCKLSLKLNNQSVIDLWSN